MKNLLFLMIMLIAIPFSISAQQKTEPEKLVVTVDDLTPDQLAKIRARNATDQITQNLETYGKYAGMGKEVGIAVKEGLTAVKDVTVDFAGTDVGKLTMMLIVWKVAGRDVFGIVGGTLFWLISMGIVIWIYRKTMLDRRVLISTEGGGFLGFGAKKTYEVVKSRYTDGEPLWFFVFFIAITGATCAIMFG